MKDPVEKDKKAKLSGPSAASTDSSELDEMYRHLHNDMRRPKPSPEEVAAAMESAQRLAAEIEAEDLSDAAASAASTNDAGACGVCGHLNRTGTKFCSMCGVPVGGQGAGAPDPLGSPQAITKESDATAPAAPRASGIQSHHYHHHYHHHYFPPGGSQDSSMPRTDGTRDLAREDRMRPMTAALRGEMSRAEAAVRRVTQEWVLACNTKHLDDLLELYTADALVMRSNHPPVRGAAAVREFFFGALDAGLGEVEVDPLRVEVLGDLAYEAGRYKALIPGAAGKRREERGKYLWVFARQGNNEYKLAADCWSSDLSLTMLESDSPPGIVKTSQPRKP